MSEDGERAPCGNQRTYRAESHVLVLLEKGDQKGLKWLFSLPLFDGVLGDCFIGSIYMFFPSAALSYFYWFFL